MNESRSKGTVRLVGALRFPNICRIAASSTDLFKADPGDHLLISQRNRRIVLKRQRAESGEVEVIFDNGRFLPHGPDSPIGLPTIIGRDEENSQITICLIRRRDRTFLYGIVEDSGGRGGAGSWVTEEQEDSDDPPIRCD